MPEQFSLALAFATVFFILFYLTFLAYNVVKKEKFSASTIVVILLNAFIYYGIGFSILEQHATGSDYLGLFTLVNALMHFGVGMFIKEQKLHDDKLFYLAVGLVLVFVTMAIPVQLDGNWVTLLWTGQAALLFWIGRTKKVPFYELFSYILIILSCLSLCEDWTTGYYAYPMAGVENTISPIFNVQFLTSILFVAAFVFINKVNYDTPENFAIPEDKSLQNFLTAGLFGIFLLTIYMAFRMEIDAYFTHLYESTRVGIKADDSDRISYKYNYDLRRLKEVWLLNYTAIFLIILSIVNLRKLKSNILGYVNIALNSLVIFAFLTYGIYELSSLHYNYFNPPADDVFSKSVGFIVIRYFSFALLGGLFFMTYQYLKERFSTKLNWVIFDLAIYITVLTIISSEFLNWLNTFGAGSADTLAITIIWGIYALIGVGVGIWKKKQHLRIGAFVLFGFTLIKLFFYDISHLDTISKTVVLVSLGVLLLLISFLYNKYMNLIFEEDKPTIDED